MISMIARYLWEAGSIIIALMGVLHLRGTLSTRAMHPRNEKLTGDMKTATLMLTEKLTMWNSWIGFNATHSCGAMFTGIVNFYLAYRYFNVLQADPFLLLLTIAAVGFYVWVAKKYWFSTVLILLSVALLCFITSAVLIIAKI